jgi:hypothetical protein
MPLPSKHSEEIPWFGFGLPPVQYKPLNSQELAWVLNVFVWWHNY